MKKIISKICIYCKKNKDSNEFNREHVVSQLFSSFQSNMVLHVVCKECNSYFSENFELPLGRDSILGLYRFLMGNNDQSAFNKAIKHKRKRVEPVVANEEHGDILIDFNHQFDGTVSSQVIVIPHTGAQVAFRIELLPTKENLEAAGLYPYKCIKILCPVDNIELQVEKFNSAFEKSGLESRVTKESFLSFRLENENKPIYLKNIMDENIALSLAKIVFNYFSYTHEDLILSKDFDKIRAYVRYCLRPGENVLFLEKKDIAIDLKDPSRIDCANIKIILYQENNKIIGEITLFNCITLQVYLSCNYPKLNTISKQGHIFDINKKYITELSFEVT